MDLHTPTTLLLIVTVSSALAATLGVIAWRNQFELELELGAGALALQALAFTLLSQRGQIADVWTVLGANLALASGVAMLAEAVYHFQRRAPPRAWIWTPVLLAALVAALLIDRAAARVSTLALLVVLQAGVVLLPLWQCRRQTPGHGQSLLAAGALLLVLIALGRLRPLPEGGGLGSQLFGGAYGQGPGFAGVVLVLLLVALGMLSMVQERAEMALTTSQAYQLFRSDVLDRLSCGQPLPAVLTAFALGVERLHPGCGCHLVLCPALTRALGVLETPPWPGGGTAARASVGEGERSTAAAAFTSRAAQLGLARCRGWPLLASDRQHLGTLMLACRDGPDAADTLRADDLTRLAALAIERSVDAQRLRDSERQYRELIESANEGICVLQDGLVRYANPKVRELTGHAEAELLGRPFLEFVHAADRTLVARKHQPRLQGKSDNLRYPARLLTHHHGARWFELSGVPLEWQGRPATLNFLTDITERRQEDELVHELAYHDSLTGLANRRLLLDHLELVLAGNRRNGRRGALLFLDLDHFKPLNDRHGHHVGDLLLVEVARRLRHCVRELDTVARFGGDEFVVLLSGLAAEIELARQQAAQIAEKARDALAEPYRLTTTHDGVAGTVEYRCSASVGVLLFAGPSEREGAAEGLLDQTDAAMYRAKEAGGNVVSFSAQPAG